MNARKKQTNTQKNLLNNIARDDRGNFPCANMCELKKFRMIADINDGQVRNRVVNCWRGVRNIFEL